MIEQKTAPSPQPEDAAYIVSVRTRDILLYLGRKMGRTDPFQDLLARLQIYPEAPPSWHTVLRQGIQAPLHINLGIPGIEEPDYPVVENLATLYAAVILDRPTVQVILSGEIELAYEEGLIGVKALIKLRNKIRELI